MPIIAGMRGATFLVPAVLAAAVSGCSPGWDWREMRVDGSGIVASLPCKPDRLARDVAVAGALLHMVMLVCRAGNTTFALAFTDLVDPALVATTMSGLRGLATANLAAATAGSASIRVPGMTPNPQAVHLILAGRTPDGALLQEQTATFCRGLRVYQATVLGESIPAGAAEAFFSGLRFNS